MRFLKVLSVLLSVLLVITSCAPKEAETLYEDAVKIVLSDDGITVDDEAIAVDSSAAVYTARDIVYYESGKDFTYGEGTEKDAHSEEEANAHQVVHISKAGTYLLSGKLSRGQIAVDLGEEAKEDPNAVVTLVLNGLDITCDVAPAIIFYNVYECGSTDVDEADRFAETSAAGANIVIADDTVNTVNGSYVERIYKPESVVLNEDQTEVEDAKKLHKYDGAFYSKMSMNIDGEKENSGILNINAENEGLDSELHLTINGGNINICSGNDGINTNEDNVSVTTINGGKLKINVTGATGEGDGIDSNGWLVINGGTVIAEACSFSADAGIDSDMGIHIDGGTVIAAGSMMDRIQEGGQTYAVFNFSEKQTDANPLVLKNEAQEEVMNYTPENDFSVFVFSSPALKEGTYTLWSGEQMLAGSQGGNFGGMGMKPEGFELPADEMPNDRPEMPEGMEPPQDRPAFPNGNQPQDRPQPPEGVQPNHLQPMQPNNQTNQELKSTFEIISGGNMFAGVSVVM